MKEGLIILLLAKKISMTPNTIAIPFYIPTIFLFENIIINPFSNNRNLQ